MLFLKYMSGQSFLCSKLCSDSPVTHSNCWRLTMGTGFIISAPNDFSDHLSFLPTPNLPPPPLHSSLHSSHFAYLKAFAMALPPTWNLILQDVCMAHFPTISKPLFKCPLLREVCPGVLFVIATPVIAPFLHFPCHCHILMCYIVCYVIYLLFIICLLLNISCCVHWCILSA